MYPETFTKYIPNMNYTLLPSEGLNELRFGASPQEIIALFGEPDEKDLDNEDDMSSEMWLYFDLKLTFFFEGVEVQRLVSIESGHPDTKLYGQEVFNLDEKALVALLKTKNALEIETEDEAWGERRVSWDDQMLDFYFKGGKLITVNWSIVDEEED